MLIRPGKNVKLFGLFGSESIGKTSIGYAVTGRLRTWGHLAEFVTDSSAAMPFPPDLFDTDPYAWVYVITKKIMREAEYSMRQNVDVIISDRTPIDLLFYYQAKAQRSIVAPHAVIRSLQELAYEWARQYDVLFYLPNEGTTFRCDNFREPTDQYRKIIGAVAESWYINDAESLGIKCWRAGGSYRERADYIYHFILRNLGHPSRTYTVREEVTEAIKLALLEGDEVPCASIKEFYFEGSHSIFRFHVPSEDDDYDMVAVCNSEYAIGYLQSWWAAEGKRKLEQKLNASLDLKFVGQKEKPHEV